MPKLAKKIQKAAANATVPGEGFPLIDPGKYTARLAKVEAKNSQAGNPVWNVEFDEIQSLDGEEIPGRQWYNLNLPQDVMPDSYRDTDPENVRTKKWDQYQGMCNGRLRGFFEAFGYTVDSDTDEMLGERAVITIGIGTIQRGPKVGQKTNQVNHIESLEAVGASAGDDDKDDDDF